MEDHDRRTMQHLWDAAHHNYTVHHDQSSSECLSQLKDMNALHGIALATSVQSQICKFCDLLLVPGKNCRVRLCPRVPKTIQKKKSKKPKQPRTLVRMHCFHCKHNTEFSGADPKELSQTDKQLPHPVNFETKPQKGKPSNISTSTDAKKIDPKSKPKSMPPTKSENQKIAPPPNQNKKRKNKQKNSLRNMLQAAKKKNTSNHSLSDFLTEL